MGRKRSKSNESVRNPTDVHKNGQRGQKSDRTVQTWTNLPKIWSNSLKLGGEVLPVSRRRFFSVESSIRFTDLGPKYSERAFPLFPVIVLTQDKSNFFFLKGPR